MSLRCKIFGHSWNLYRENVSYIIFIKIKIPKGEENTWSMDVRLCRRCYCKQIKTIGLTDFDWSDWELTKEELRDKNLKELGI
jgi:hypothetical protein